MVTEMLWSMLIVDLARKSSIVAVTYVLVSVDNMPPIVG